jgi:hypothetical protein
VEERLGVLADVRQQRSIVPGFGLDMSMWQRHTQPFAFSGTSE